MAKVSSKPLATTVESADGIYLIQGGLSKFARLNVPWTLRTLVVSENAQFGSSGGHVITIVGQSILVNSSLIFTHSVGERVGLTSSGTTGAQFTIANTDTGGKDWGIYSTGAGNTGGAGNLAFYNNTSARYGMALRGDRSAMMLGGASAVDTFNSDDGSSILTLIGNGSVGDSASRTNIRFVNGGYDVPSNDASISSGDKSVFWNASGLKIGQGLENGGLWWQASGSSITAGFKWYGGTGSPAMQMRLTPANALILTETTANPGTSDLTADGAVAMYNKADKLVFAYNNGGTMTYITLDLDGSDTSWSHSTSAP
jgi:hypothetical protein